MIQWLPLGLYILKSSRSGDNPEPEAFLFLQRKRELPWMFSDVKPNILELST
jgi:hypothetical protein